MKVIIDIPKDFEEHFNQDKFKDSLLRLKANTNYGLEHESTISGIYEIELLDMFVVAFEKARIAYTDYEIEVGISMWLIDGNALLEEIDEEIDLYDDDSNREETLIRLGLKIARKDIVKRQGVEVIKQAEWKINSDGYYPYCSCCGVEPERGKLTKFCANCGCEMKGE